MNLNVTKIAFLKSKSYNDESVFIAFMMNKLFSATDMNKNVSQTF